MEHLICVGGPWACPVLQAILSESSLLQNEGWYLFDHFLWKHYFVFNIRGSKSNKKPLCFSLLPEYSPVDGFISSELPVLFELRVRYLLSHERVREAMALAKCCAWHPTAGQHLFFLQVYLSWLLKTSQHDILRKEVGVLLLFFF